MFDLASLKSPYAGLENLARIYLQSHLITFGLTSHAYASSYTLMQFEVYDSSLSSV